MSCCRRELVPKKSRELVQAFCDLLGEVGAHSVQRGGRTAIPPGDKRCAVGDDLSCSAVPKGKEDAIFVLPPGAAPMCDAAGDNATEQRRDIAGGGPREARPSQFPQRGP